MALYMHAWGRDGGNYVESISIVFIYWRGHRLWKERGRVILQIWVDMLLLPPLLS